MFLKFEKKTISLSMESESNLHHKNTEQLINGMMSFLDETTECYKKEANFDDLKNPVSAGIKNIIGMFPAPPPAPQNSNISFQSHQDDTKTFSKNNQMKSSHMDGACRYKDPYMQEVNRLMFCSTMGHPTNGSPEHFQAAENYALYGKDFLDFPTDNRFSKPMDVSSLSETSPQFSSSFAKPLNTHVYGMSSTTGKSSNMVNPPSVTPQLPVMINSANYCGYPFYQTPNFVQPSLMYSNHFLMTQYWNMFARETQINATSIVQQHQFLSGGINNERLVYAQMIQQQTQTNQGNSYLSGISGDGVVKPKISKLQDVKKIEQPSSPNVTSDGSSEFMKAILNGSNLCENKFNLDN